MQTVDLMDKYNIGYGSVNHTRNRCLSCGFENAEKDFEKCPASSWEISAKQAVSADFQFTFLEIHDIIK